MSVELTEKERAALIKRLPDEARERFGEAGIAAWSDRKLAAMVEGFAAKAERLKNEPERYGG